VFNYFESFESQIRLAALEQIMEHEDENYRTLTESYEEIRNIKHDLKNQTALLNDLINQEKYPEAKEHISRLYKTVERATSMCCTGNPAVDSIIDLKGDLARSQGISYMTKLKITELTCDTVGLCRILGNALDNAIEATQKITDPEEKHIDVKVSVHNSTIVAIIRNPVVEDIDTDLLETTKKDSEHHGIGILSMKEIASKYNGEILFTCQNNTFEVRIFLQNFSPKI
jgi:sensor histidine kinase regulating citrate/malate metabolism